MAEPVRDADTKRVRSAKHRPNHKGKRRNRNTGSGSDTTHLADDLTSEPEANRRVHFAEEFSPPPVPGIPISSEGTRAASSELLPLPKATEDGTARFPIDLPTSLQLAGANNLQIALATERVREAAARRQRADVMWVPSVNAGIAYNKHDGRIQETEGNVIEVSRNSLFVGGGPVLSGSPLPGGAGGPPRLFVDLPVVDVLFEPLAARQSVRAADADHAVTFNDTLVGVAFAYLALVRAQFQVGIAEEAVTNADELSGLTEDFARAGAGLQADAQRAQVELARRKRDLVRAHEVVAVASTDLARRLRLDPAVVLNAVETHPFPIELVDESTPLRALIAQGLASRPETTRQNAVVQEACFRVRQERYRPWLPHLYLGFNAGGFGGGPSTYFGNFSDRTDFDAAAVWEIENWGAGNGARQRERASVYRQALLAARSFRDRISAEVAQAYHRVQWRREQIEATQPQVEAAVSALRLNFDGIRGNELRPIEAQQAIGALATSRTLYLDAMLDYNRAQFELLRAIGQPPTEGRVFRPVEPTQAEPVPDAEPSPAESAT